MTPSRFLIIISTLASSLALLAMLPALAADSSAPNITAQPAAPAPDASIHSQPNDDRALEIAPQPGVTLPNKGIDEIPVDRSFKPNEERANLDRNFNPDDLQDGKPKMPKSLPCLGMTLKYDTKCYLGQEEHGLKIVHVDPGRPADKAGLAGSDGSGAIAHAAQTALALLGPFQMIFQKPVARWTEGDGDFIVAANDHRIHGELDLEDELAKLKPGDTLYLTVLRPLPGGAHKEFKVEVKVGQPCTEGDNSYIDDSDAENFAY